MTAVHQIVVCSDSSETQQDSDTFRCCPLGLHFYCDDELQPYRILALQLSIPDPDGPALTAECRGIVVQTALDAKRNQYRVWVLFTEIDPKVRSRLKCVSKTAGTQCPHCMNY